MSVLNLRSPIWIAVLLAGCATGGNHAPVSDRGLSGRSAVVPVVASSKKSGVRETDWRPQTHVVQKGDTLYGVALNYGLDYHEIVALNNIQNPDMIRIGQELRLFASGTEVTIKPVEEAKPVEKPLPPVKPVAEPVLVEIPLKILPLALKLPYSEEAVAQIAKMQGGAQIPEATALTKVEIKPVSVPVSIPEIKTASASDDDEAVDWSMPTTGKIVAGFSESANRKGIDVVGKLGQPIVASAAGKVVYSGSGLRGYGKLIIIKHNNTYLSAYAHNDQILVKEGQAVTKGQKIAEMGDSDADQVKLHFEIRKLGKPVDPVKYLPQS